MRPGEGMFLPFFCCDATGGVCFRQAQFFRCCFKSDALAEEFARGAREAGNEVEVVEKMHEYELRRTI